MREGQGDNHFDVGLVVLCPPLRISPKSIHSSTKIREQIQQHTNTEVMRMNRTPLEWINHVENVIDEHASSMHDEDHWNVQRSIVKVKALLLILPERTVSSAFESFEFSELEKSIMQEWAESTMPIDGWSDHFLSQVVSK